MGVVVTHTDVVHKSNFKKLGLCWPKASKPLVYNFQSVYLLCVFLWIWHSKIANISSESNMLNLKMFLFTINSWNVLPCYWCINTNYYKMDGQYSTTFAFCGFISTLLLRSLPFVISMTAMTLSVPMTLTLLKHIVVFIDSRLYI